jgi:hypothetical protein
MPTLSSDDDAAATLVRLIRAGDVEALRCLLDYPELASARFRGTKGTTRTPLQVVADWPGYFPNGPMIVHLLIAAGADPDAPIIGGRCAETALHWAASSNDVDVAAALIAGGADLEAPGASIAGGTPLDNAVGYGCWHVARLLVQQGARVERLWHAAALGIMPRLEELLAADPPPAVEEINNAFWQACSGGQRRVAEYLLGRGADINWVPHYTQATPLDAAGGPDTRRDTLVGWLRDRGAKSAKR